MARGFEKPPWWAVVVVVVGLVFLMVGLPFALNRGGEPLSKAELDRMAAAASSANAADEAAQPKVIAFLGDSWTVGSGATDANGYAPRTAAEANATASLFGESSSGYTVPGDGGTVFGDRVDKVVASAPDVVVVEGSLNDSPTDAATITQAATEVLQSLRDQLPDVPILVVGSSFTPGTKRADIQKVNGAVSAAAGAVGLQFVDPAAEGWLDPADASLWHDGKHPNDGGHQRFADRLAAVLPPALAG